MMLLSSLSCANYAEVLNQLFVLRMNIDAGIHDGWFFLLYESSSDIGSVSAVLLLLFLLA